MADEMAFVLLDKVDLTRRAALRKLLLGTAYTLPAIASFSMGGRAIADPLPPCYLGNQTLPCSPIGLLSDPPAVPSLTASALPLFGAVLGGAAIAVMTRKTSDS